MSYFFQKNCSAKLCNYKEEDNMFKKSNTSGKVVELKEIYEEDFGTTVSKYKSNEVRSIKRDIFGEYLSEIQEKKGKNISGEITPTGIKSLDDKIGGGLQEGVYVIGANPGVGKTSLILSILNNLALNKKYSLFFNLDMSDIQTTLRLISNFSYKCEEVNSYKINDLSNVKNIFNGGIMNGDIVKLYETYNKKINDYIHVLSVNYDDINSSSTVTYIESVKVSIKNFIKYYKCKPVVVIDYFQLLKKSDDFEYDEVDAQRNMKIYDRRLEIDQLISELKGLSKIYHLPIIVISANNRASYSNERDVYDISFSKESGDIEYRTDALIRLTAGCDKTNFGGPDLKCVNLHICKSRYGLEHVSMALDFIPEYAYFQDSNERDD